MLRLNAPNSISAGASSQTPLRELTALSQTPWLDLRKLTFQGREGRRETRKKKGEGRKGREEKGRKG